MNIFFLSRDPRLAALYHCDAHCIKMILESAQLLFTAHHEIDASLLTAASLDTPDGSVPVKVYRPTHRNHPSAKWTRSSLQHYRWLTELAMALCEEYTRRYERVHATQHGIVWLCRNPPPGLLDAGWEDPPQCMPEVHHRKDVVEAYREFYRQDKAKLARFAYTKADRPDWLQISPVSVKVRSRKTPPRATRKSPR